jgi:DNA (cytosine-5)-methyltransferase 1
VKLTAYHRVGRNRGTDRIFLESHRLTRLGFAPGQRFNVSGIPNGVRLDLCEGGSNTVSSRRISLVQRPVIDICSSLKLAPLKQIEEVRIQGSLGHINILPSIRGLTILNRRNIQPPFRVLELFAGGGTLSKAIIDSPLYTLVAGVEIETKYADVWEQTHPNAELIQSDIRLIHPNELPDHDILVAGIPCTEHSAMGRAKKSLAGKPETGECGDLFMAVAHLIAVKMPAVCVFENVTNYGQSLAGETLKGHLQKLGYHIHEQILQPNAEWNEPSDRKRWVMIATLKHGFHLKSPQKAFTGTANDFLDPPDPERDRADAERIAKTICGLQAHNARHQAMGHGFGFTTLTGSETKIPTLVRSYHKINTGPFVETPYGHRLLRQSEIELIMGSKVATQHYATACEILGQGVQTRIFREIFRQIAGFLLAPDTTEESALSPTHTRLFQEQLDL